MFFYGHAIVSHVLLGHAIVSQPARTYLLQLCVDTGSSFKDLWEQWMIRMDGEREKASELSMLSAQLDDDDNDDYFLSSRISLGFYFFVFFVFFFLLKTHLKNLKVGKNYFVENVF